MWRAVLRATILAAVLTAGGPTRAWLVYTDRDDPLQWVVEIEQSYGDIVALHSLPPPLNRVMRSSDELPPPVFRWRYDRDAEGLAILAVNQDGQGRIGFEFIVREPIEGQRLGAAAVLIDGNGMPLHTFYARADTVGGTFAAGARHRHISLVLHRAPDWWRSVEAIAFFSMRYHPQQELDDEEVWEAMRRVVGNFTKGQGTEQRE
jgi:hypothetical protein